MDDQVHFAVGALPQLPDDLVVLVDLQPLQVLSRDELQLVQDVHAGAGHQRRGGTHGGSGVERDALGNRQEGGGRPKLQPEREQQLTAGVTAEKQTKKRGTL